jgi:RNA polymerase sigma-54 factor
MTTNEDIAEFLVGSIDDMGYIRVPDIVDDMAFTQGLYTDDVTVERMLTVIHELEPSSELVIYKNVCCYN